MLYALGEGDEIFNIFFTNEFIENIKYLCEL